MKSDAITVDGYVESLPADRKAAVQQLRQLALKKLPKGFEETMGYGMMGYVVPISTYPAGYHCAANTPLPFINIASQKNFIAVYHMGLYANPELLQWFTDSYITATGKKPDMGKSCIRFKKPETIPFDLLGELFSKMTVKDWITLYEKAFRK